MDKTPVVTFVPPLELFTEELIVIHFFSFIKKVDMTFGACVAYLVDVMHSRSSEILATIESVSFFSFLFYRLEFKD